MCNLIQVPIETSTAKLFFSKTKINLMAPCSYKSTNTRGLPGKHPVIAAVTRSVPGLDTFWPPQKSNGGPQPPIWPVHLPLLPRLPLSPVCSLPRPKCLTPKWLQPGLLQSPFLLWASVTASNLSCHSL